MKYYKISEAHLQGLLTMAHHCQALHMGGVDNWEGYGESISNYVNDCSATDFKTYEDIEDIVEEDLKSYTEINSPLT